MGFPYDRSKRLFFEKRWSRDQDCSVYTDTPNCENAGYRNVIELDLLQEKVLGKIGELSLSSIEKGGRTLSKVDMTSAEGFWYVLQCISFGAGYMAKVPMKKALHDSGLIPTLASAENFWYVIQNIFLGSGYFWKVVHRKALHDAGLVSSMTSAEGFWYVLLCIWFGAGYFLKLSTARALCDANAYTMTTAGNFWYILQCIPFGAAYMRKVPVKKALSEL